MIESDEYDNIQFSIKTDYISHVGSSDTIIIKQDGEELAKIRGIEHGKGHKLIDELEG